MAFLRFTVSSSSTRGGRTFCEALAGAGLVPEVDPTVSRTGRRSSRRPRPRHRRSSCCRGLFVPAPFLAALPAPFFPAPFFPRAGGASRWSLSSSTSSRSASAQSGSRSSSVTPPPRWLPEPLTGSPMSSSPSSPPSSPSAASPRSSSRSSPRSSSRSSSSGGGADWDRCGFSGSGAPKIRGLRRAGELGQLARAHVLGATAPPRPCGRGRDRGPASPRGAARAATGAPAARAARPSRAGSRRAGGS